MKHALALEYERPHGYLTSKTRHPNQGKKANKGFQKLFFASGNCPIKFMGNAIPEDVLEEETLRDEIWAKSQVAMFGVIGGNSAEATVETIYDILGWQDSLTTPNDYHCGYSRSHDFTADFEERDAKDVGEPSRSQLPTYNWPTQKPREPMW